MLRNVNLKDPLVHSLPRLCYFFPLSSKYLPQHLILEHLQSAFLPGCDDQVSHPYKTDHNLNRKSYKSGFIYLLVEMAPSVFVFGDFFPCNIAILYCLNFKGLDFSLEFPLKMR